MRTAEEQIHSLEIPLTDLSLLVPSAAVAEVTNPTDLVPIAGTGRWLLGAVGWRSQAVPVVSFEALIGGPVSFVSPASKIVVFYPFAGRHEQEFYAFLSLSEPRPQPVAPSLIEPVDPARLPDTPLIATGVRIKGRTLLIPDFDALKRTFYP